VRIAVARWASKDQKVYSELSTERSAPSWDICLSQGIDEQELSQL
jgi:hypothetical protein